MTAIGKAPAARLEISIDGVSRTCRDRKEITVEAAARLMTKYPHSVVTVWRRVAPRPWPRADRGALKDPEAVMGELAEYAAPVILLAVVLVLASTRPAR
jgi:hypothetical protein